jgi:hypothetical protein
MISSYSSAIDGSLFVHSGERLVLPEACKRSRQRGLGQAYDARNARKLVSADPGVDLRYEQEVAQLDTHHQDKSSNLGCLI